MKRLLHIVCILPIVLLALSGCEQMNTDPTANVSLSVDTLRFDTLFTQLSSATRIVMVRNQTKGTLVIERVRLADGRYFQINLDGAGAEGMQVLAGDSAFLFVRARIEEQKQDLPVFIEDQVLFSLSNGNLCTLQIEAYGQDVVFIDSLYIASNYTFTANKPYLVQKYIAASPDATVTIDAGATFYMNKDAQVHIYGALQANGTTEAPIRFCGKRLDDYVQGIPYAYVPGQWNGIYLYDYEGKAPDWQLTNVQITSGTNGLFCEGKDKNNHPTLTLHNALIHNHDQYGLVLSNVDANVDNSEISNCASHCVYLRNGKYVFEQNTIASYYRHTMYNSNVGLYDTPREDVSAVYVDDLSKSELTEVHFLNNIITGVRSSQLMLAYPLPKYYPGEFRGNYLKCDTLFLNNAKDNVYATDSDSVFVNDYYADYTYYDFRLDSLSPARGIGDSIVASRYPKDLLGNERMSADAGCYVYVEEPTNEGVSSRP